jgi:hypothetical protein
MICKEYYSMPSYGESFLSSGEAYNYPGHPWEKDWIQNLEFGVTLENLGVFLLNGSTHN